MSTPINFRGQSIKTALALSSENIASTNNDSSTLIIVAVLVVVVVLVIVVLLVKHRRSNNNKLKPFSSANFKLSNSRNF
jgi:heme/copper-type cytochrome/quinol oxidase subunit 2